jgi:3-deoxy-D-manno-octulosonic-acid transferase
VTGNMKYDLTRASGRHSAPSCVERFGYSDADVVIIGGSLHEREDEALLDAFAARARQTIARR